MTDPYKQVFEDIVKALTNDSNMIVWLAKRLLSVKEFEEFINEFECKNNDDKKNNVRINT